ncbi:hypothetical protein D3C75_1345100 [compost metagenome]
MIRLRLVVSLLTYTSANQCGNVCSHSPRQLLGKVYSNAATATSSSCSRLLARSQLPVVRNSPPSQRVVNC